MDYVLLSGVKLVATYHGPRVDLSKKFLTAYGMRYRELERFCIHMRTRRYNDMQISDISISVRSRRTEAGSHTG